MTEYPIDTHPDLKIECSCGRIAVIRWNGEKYACDDPAWSYHSDPDIDAGNDSSRLWNCGSENHCQGRIVGAYARQGFRLYSTKGATP